MLFDAKGEIEENEWKFNEKRRNSKVRGPKYKLLKFDSDNILTGENVGNQLDYNRKLSIEIAPKKDQFMLWWKFRQNWSQNQLCHAFWVDLCLSEEDSHAGQFPFLILNLYGNNSWLLFNLIVEVRNWSYYIVS